MSAHRKSAIVTGVLFIVATATALISDSLTKSILDAPDFLGRIFANQSQVLIGVLLHLVAAGTSAGIAISLYPVLRKYREGLALGSVCFRVIEAVFYLVSTLGLLALVSLSQQFAEAGSPATSDFAVLGTLLLAVRKWAGFVLGATSFCVGGLLYYVVFFQSRLIPRWLSGWGVIGLVLLLAMLLQILFGAEAAGSTVLLAVPIAVQEMVLAVWLIVKGFNPTALAAKPA